jgi:hypothetical protein
MRASKIGRWVGRAAVVASLGLGASLAAGGTAQAAAASDTLAKYSVAGHRAPVADVVNYGTEWL